MLEIGDQAGDRLVHLRRELLCSLRSLLWESQ